MEAESSWEGLSSGIGGRKDQKAEHWATPLHKLGSFGPLPEEGKYPERTSGKTSIYIGWDYTVRTHSTVTVLTPNCKGYNSDSCLAPVLHESTVAGIPRYYKK